MQRIQSLLIIFVLRNTNLKIPVMKNLFCAFIVITFILTGCAGKDKTDAIKVMTLNVRYDNPGDSINAWPNRATQVCQFITDQKPDIFGMQEVLWHQYKLLDSVLTDYSSVGAGRDDGARKGEMNPVFYRKDKYELIRNITFWLSDTPDVPGSKGWGASLPRIVTWMELSRKSDHEHFFYFNTHFAHDSDSARIMSAHILLNQVMEIAGEFPFVITGDFNMQPDSKGYSILTGPNESVPVLTDAYTISSRKPSGPSFTFNGFSDKPGDGRIDYIFVKNGMEVLDHKTFAKKDGEIFISDHWPVEALVSLKTVQE